MAKAKRKPPSGKPITAHPLFPAVVALWFGALFGLGSLAIRPALLDKFVISNRIDLIIHAATPPLGVTARILIALVLAAIGAWLGARLARRIARPKQESRPRRRGMETRDEGAADPRAGQSYFQAPARRRSLAIEHEEQEFVPHEMAPLPGGQPQILDIASMGAGIGVDVEEPQVAAPVAISRTVEPGTPTPPVALDWSKAPTHPTEPSPVEQVLPQQFQPAQPLPAVDPMPEPVQQFQPAAAATFVPPAVPAAFAPPAVPAAYAPESSAPMAERQVFGVAVIDDHVSQDFVRGMGFKTSVFEADTPEPLFPSRQSAEESSARTTPAVPVEQIATPQLSVETLPSFTAPAPEPVIEASAAPSAPVAPQPSVASLGMTDLTSRLAETMQRRRAARGEVQATPIAAPTESAEPVQAEFVAVPEPVAAPAEEPALPVLPSCAPPPPLAQFSPAAALQPVAETPPPAPLEMPAALRPLQFDDADDGDHEELASLLPPRRVVFEPAPVAAPEWPEVASEPVSSEPAPVLELDIEVEDGPAVPEENFASLLDLGRASFVRVEEPEPAAETIEPVVIFPGQTAQTAAPAAFAPPPPSAPFASPVVPPASNEAVPFRRFDAPSIAGQGQPVAGQANVSAIDPAEADQALRAALANLQRMSSVA